ncbi:MAG: hypothetical protein VB090_03355, partial [Petrimonas sp.]|nr:hypothetical protein [Petrimonas sp.]
DSNPRYSYPYGSLANCWFQPLTHTSRYGFRPNWVQIYKIVFILSKKTRDFYLNLPTFFRVCVDV